MKSLKGPNTTWIQPQRNPLLRLGSQHNWTNSLNLNDNKVKSRRNITAPVVLGRTGVDQNKTWVIINSALFDSEFLLPPVLSDV